MLMRSMGDNVVFVVKPSFQNGLDVTVEWQLGEFLSHMISHICSSNLFLQNHLSKIFYYEKTFFLLIAEWEKTGRSIGKGYSFYTVHVYKGKVIFRNLEMIMEPLLKMEPLRLVSAFKSADF